MKFKVLKNTELYNNIYNILNEKVAAINASMDLCKKLGGITFRPSGWSIGGGISSICFPVEQDLKIWKKTGYGPLEYMPRLNSKLGKEISAQIAALPEVRYTELNGLFGPKSPFWCPAIQNAENCFILNIPDKYANSITNTDLIEILNSEYFALKEAQESAKIPNK